MIWFVSRVSSIYWVDNLLGMYKVKTYENGKKKKKKETQELCVLF